MSTVIKPKMISIAIQAGGQSSRMGQDKALRPFLGKPLIQRVIERVAHLGDELFITTNQPEGYRFLNIPLFPDISPGTGALGGLYTALKTAQYPLVAVVACDMPFANPNLLNACIQIMADATVEAVIPSTDFGLEPIHAVYRREPCLRAIETALSAGQRRLISWHKDANAQILSPQETRELDPFGITFQNVNTPEDFHAAQEMAKSLEKNFH